MERTRTGGGIGWSWPSLAVGGLLVLLMPLAIGCINPSSLEFLLMPWKDNKVPAEIPLTSANPKKKKKEVTVVILASFANPLETRPEFQTVDRDLCMKLSQKLAERFEANHEKIKIVPYHKVKSYLNKELDPNLISKRDIGKHFEADFVIHLEINSMSFYEGSYRQLFRGRTEIGVTMFDMEKDAEEGPTKEQIYQCQYPNTGPIDADAGNGSQSLIAFRSTFMDRVARDLSRYFAAYPADERLDMR